MFRNTDDVEDRCCFGEDGVHLFEGAVGGFGVEEVDYGDYEGIDYGEDYVGFVADCCEGDRGYLLGWGLAWRVLGRWW